MYSTIFNQIQPDESYFEIEKDLPFLRQDQEEHNLWILVIQDRLVTSKPLALSCQLTQPDLLTLET